MAGHIPEFLAKNHFVTAAGEKALIDDYYHISAPGPNSDELIVKLSKAWGDTQTVSYIDADIGPLPATDIPDWLEKGAIVAFESRHSKIPQVTRVAHYWGMQERDMAEAKTMVATEGFTSMPLEKFRPATQTETNEFITKSNADAFARRARDDVSLAAARAIAKAAVNVVRSRYSL